MSSISLTVMNKWYISFCFCKDLAVYYMTPTCKISFLENLGGWQMLWNKRNWEFGSSFCHYLRFAQLSQTDFTDFPDLVFVPGRCAQWLNFWNSLTPLNQFLRPEPFFKCGSSLSFLQAVEFSQFLIQGCLMIKTFMWNDLICKPACCFSGNSLFEISFIWSILRWAGLSRI